MYLKNLIAVIIRLSLVLFFNQVLIFFGMVIQLKFLSSKMHDCSAAMIAYTIALLIAVPLLIFLWLRSSAIAAYITQKFPDPISLPLISDQQVNTFLWLAGGFWLCTSQLEFMSFLIPTSFSIIINIKHFGSISNLTGLLFFIPSLSIFLMGLGLILNCRTNNYFLKNWIAPKDEAIKP